MENYINIIKKGSLFNDFSDTEIQEILYNINAKIASFKKGEYIFNRGDEVFSFGMLVEGKASIQKVDYDGNLSIISSLTPKDLFAEAFAYAGVKKMPISVLCIEDCKVILVTKKDIANLINYNSSLYLRFNDNMLSAMAKRLFYLNKKVEILNQPSIREKVLTYLDLFFDTEKNKNIEIPFNREQFANFLCVNRASLSRELAKMKEEKIIDFHKNTFRKL